MALHGNGITQRQCSNDTERDAWASVEDKPGYGRQTDYERFLDAEPKEKRESHQGNDHSRNVVNRLTGKYEGCSRDGTSGSGGGSPYERFYVGVISIAEKPATGNDDTQVYRGKDSDSGDDSSDQSANQVTDKRGRDDYWAGGYEPHGDRVEELGLGQPVMLFDHS